MALELTVLGSSGSYAAEGDACAGYLVESEGFKLLLDAGPGCLANLQTHCALSEIDAVVLSHAHPDHWLDLPLLRTARRCANITEPLTILGGADHLTLAENLMGPKMSEDLNWKVVAGGNESTLGPLSLRFSRTDHPVETLAVRIQSGEVAVGYSADTGPGWTLNELGRDLALAVIESTYLDEDKDQAAGVHLTAWQAGALGRLAGARHLALTHILPTVDRTAVGAEGEDAFGGPVHVASPHLRFDL